MSSTFPDISPNPGKPLFSVESATRSRVARILVVDDDPSMRLMVTGFLNAHGMKAFSAGGRQEMFAVISAEEPDLILMDLHLGEDDGLDLLREIRGQSDLPVILMTGRRCDEIDHVVGLELGADDYLNKPFGLRELLARTRAVLRRWEKASQVFDKKQDRSRYRFGEWQLSKRTRTLTDGKGQPVVLTKGEYALLVAFLDSPQRPLSREHLMQTTRAHEDVFDRSIDVQILRLRRKLEENARSPTLIRTERGVGYIFTASVSRF